jgi:hypothetical protein
MVALDGKVLRGAWEELPDVKVELFSALVHGEGVIIGQRKVSAETTEVTQVIPLLDDIAAGLRPARPPGSGHDAGPDGDLAGVCVTADALHVHKDNIGKVFDHGGDYVLTVKGNMPSLERHLAALFPAGPGDGPSPLTTSPLTAAMAGRRSAPSGAPPSWRAWTFPAATRPSASTAKSST